MCKYTCLCENVLVCGCVCLYASARACLSECWVNACVHMCILVVCVPEWLSMCMCVRLCMYACIFFPVCVRPCNMFEWFIGCLASFVCVCAIFCRRYCVYMCVYEFMHATACGSMQQHVTARSSMQPHVTHATARVCVDLHVAAHYSMRWLVAAQDST